jgi:hypothetical protein
MTEPSANATKSGAAGPHRSRQTAEIALALALVTGMIDASWWSQGEDRSLPATLAQVGMILICCAG